jgi:aspartyl-tRNA(Asn)/glutamyl-tRNA(Gln) amidotransferase subunit A
LNGKLNGDQAVTKLTIDEIRDRVTSASQTAADIARSFYGVIEDRNPKINAYLTLSRDRAEAQAAKVDAAVTRGDDPGPLAGVPVGIKDVLATNGTATTAGSKILEGYRPPYDCTAVARLEQAGAVILGKLNCDEFAMGSSNENSAYGPVRNPLALDRVPGGSSGGSAAAVAANMAVATLGTDTGGSIRQPAAFCGVVGVLPTYGRVSRYGLFAFASSLDKIGPFAHTVKDAATVLQVIAGHDPLDATSSTSPVPDFSAKLNQGVRGLRIGVPSEFFGEGLDAEIRQQIEVTLDKLKQQGAEIVQISLPHTKYAIPTYYVVATAEASANLARYDGVRFGYRAPAAEAKTLGAMYRESRERGFGPEVKRRILLGTYALSAGYYDAYYKKAQQVRALITRDYLEAFQKVDIIAGPTTPTTAFKLGEKTDDPLAMYLADIYTVTGSLAGLCGLSVPCGASAEGLPIGMQILGKHFDEPTVFQAAAAVERSA